MKASIVEWYARWMWPVHRLFIRLKKRCKNCILTGELKGGLCELCRQQTNNFSTSKPHTSSPTDISKLTEAVLLLSGGKDSAYVLNRLRQEHPNLKIACVLVNTGFMSPLAIPNAVGIAQKTQTELLIVNSYIDKFKEVLRGALLKLNGRGSYGVIDFAEGNLIFEIGKQIAGERILISGMTHAQLNHIDTGVDNNLIFPMDWWRIGEEELIVANLVSGTPATTNSTLVPMMVMLDIKNLGYCSFEPEFAQLIRERKANRKTWLYIFELSEYLVTRGFLDKELEKSLKNFNLTPEEVLCSPS